MYIGHVGVALAARRLRTSIGLLVLLIATYTPDWVDTGLCLAGRYDAHEMLSHSISAVLVFALIGFIAYALLTRNWTSAVVISVVILSHLPLDWVTGYKPTWPGGPMIGLQLYDRPAADFLAEGILIFVGALLYERTLPPRQRPWVDVSIMLCALLTLQLTVDVAHMMMKTLPKC
jgi:hypothetical protein